MSYKKDRLAIEKLLTEGFDDYTGGHNGPTDGGQYDDENPKNGYTETISKIRNLQQNTMTVYEFVENQLKNNKSPHHSQVFPDILNTLQNVSLELGKYAGSYTTDEY